MKNRIYFTIATLALTGFSPLSEAAPKPGGPSKSGGNGSYSGLIEGNSFETAGFINITVSGKGAVTISYTIGGQRATLRGAIDATSSLFVVKSGDANPANLVFSVVSETGTVTQAHGTLTVNDVVIPFSAPLLPHGSSRAGFPAAGKFTAVLDGVLEAGSVETTAGIARLHVLPHGKLKIDPVMADGSVLPLMTQIASDGSVRFWRPIGKTGALTGTLQFAAQESEGGELSGSLQWFKPASKSRYHAEAFNALLTVEGSSYDHKAPLLDFSASSKVGVFSVELEELAAPYVTEGTLADGKKPTFAGNENVKVNFNRGVGLINGSLSEDGLGKFTLLGVVLQKQNVARGLVFGDSGTGRFELAEKIVAP